MKDTHTKFSTPTIALHWLVGVVLIGLLGVGWYMAEYKVYFLYPIHKSIGILILAVVFARVWWRLRNGFPSPLGDSARLQKIARISHWILLIGTVMLPISGMMMSAMGGHGLAIFGLELLGPNVGADGKIVANNEMIAGVAHSIHHWAGKVLMVTVAVHVLAALKHHFFDKDGTLRRMLGQTTHS